jgi:hypothetical protein
VNKSEKHDMLQALLSAMYKSLEGGWWVLPPCWAPKRLGQALERAARRALPTASLPPPTRRPPPARLPPPPPPTAQLGVKAGLEFTAARRAAERVVQGTAARYEAAANAAIEECLGGGGRSEPGSSDGSDEGGAAAEGDAGAPGSAGGGGGGEEEDDEAGAVAVSAGTDGAAAAAAMGAARCPTSGVQIVLGDRPASETLKCMWGALRPMRRLQFCWEIVRSLFEPVREGVEAGAGVRAASRGIGAWEERRCLPFESA